MKGIKFYLKSQIEEIGRDDRLRIYGSFLALTMVWTWILWMQKGIVKVLAQDPAFPLCWPFLKIVTHFVFGLLVS